MTTLSQKRCKPCEEGTPAFTADEIAPQLQELGHNWRVRENHHLEKTFRFPDFRTALRFVNQIGELAEQEQHHPDLTLSWGKVGITLWSHKAGGLTENDFILAAKIDRIGESA